MPKAGHNIKYDWQVLRSAGVELGGVAYDSMLASFVLDPGRRSHAIDTLALEHLGVAMQCYDDVAGKGKLQIPFAEVAVRLPRGYCGADSATVLALRELFLPTARPRRRCSRCSTTIEMPLVEVLADMEWTGIRIDPELFRPAGAGAVRRTWQRLEAEIAVAAGGSINLNSPKQLATVLFDRLQLPDPQADQDRTLHRCRRAGAAGRSGPRRCRGFCSSIGSCRSSDPPMWTCCPRRSTGRRDAFTPASTRSAPPPAGSPPPSRTCRTFRCARRAGEEIRKGFVPAEGWKLVVADYSQIELRLMAHLSQDPAFLDAFRKGEDIHRQTASIIFGVALARRQRRNAGAGQDHQLRNDLRPGRVRAVAACWQFRRTKRRRSSREYFKRFAGVRACLDRQIELARERGYVETIFGRRRYIPEMRGRELQPRAFGERACAERPAAGLGGGSDQDRDGAAAPGAGRGRSHSPAPPPGAR